jgi:hypothetical protein
MIANAITTENDEVLTEEERDKLRPFWIYKIRECLDDRVLTRAGNDFIDCFTFCKRFFGTLDDEDVFDTAVSLAYDSVTISAVPIAHLTVVQRDILNSIYADSDKTLPASDIRKWLLDRGRFTGNTTMYRHLNKLIEKGFIIKIAHGEYSTLRPNTRQTDEQVHAFDELLRLL